MEPKYFIKELEKWGDLFTPFFNSKKGKKFILDFNKHIKEISNINDIFNCFKYTAPKNLKVIWQGVEPFLDNTSDGLCFSSQNKINSTTKVIFNAIANEFNIPFNNFNLSYGLKYLSEQGVLLLNKNLTVKSNSPLSHTELWQDFNEYFFTIIKQDFPHVPIIFYGKKSLPLNVDFDKNNPTYIFNHPLFCIKNNIDLNLNKNFILINDYLRTHFNWAITYNYDLWEEKKQDMLKDPESMAIRMMDDFKLPF